MTSLFLWTGAATAAVIGFDKFSDSNQPVYTGHTEQGFVINPVLGEWREAFYFGTPAPAIFSRSDMADIKVQAEDGSFFEARSINIGNGSLNPGSVLYMIQGLMGGSTIFNVAGEISDLGAFNLVALDETLLIDTLLVKFDKNTAASFSIDNIDVSLDVDTDLVTAPLPSALTLMLVTGGLLFGLKRRA